MHKTTKRESSLLYKLFSFLVYVYFTNDRARTLEQCGPAHSITKCYLTSHSKVASAPSVVIQHGYLAVVKIYTAQKELKEHLIITVLKSGQLKFWDIDLFS